MTHDMIEALEDLAHELGATGRHFEGASLEALFEVREELLRDKERLDFVLETIRKYGTDGIKHLPWTVLYEDGEDSDIAFDRDAIDAAMRRGGGR